MSTPPATPPRPQGTTFSIVPHYHDLLAKDPTLTPPIAAIESLISLLSSSPITTVSETLSLISHASIELLQSQANPIPVSAGTDLFQRYLITTFQNLPIASQSGSDFSQLRSQLIKNSKVFVTRAKSARTKIARHGLPLIRDETVVITYGSSRIVGNLLCHAAADAGRWFRVVQVLPSTLVSTRTTTQINQLRRSGIEVATIPLSSLTYTLHTLRSANLLVLTMLGTSAVLENGAVVSEMGCGLVAELSFRHSVPVYIATESYKFARQLPVAYGQADLKKMGTAQEVLRFTTATASATATAAEDKEDKEEERKELVDITPPDLITGLVTENGVMTPDAVAEELIKLWF